MRRKPADWMKPADDRILEMLMIGEERLWLPPRALYANMNISENWVNKRLAVLTKEGLVDRDGSLYRISDAGVDYLSGKLDVSEL